LVHNYFISCKKIYKDKILIFPTNPRSAVCVFLLIPSEFQASGAESIRVRLPTLVVGRLPAQEPDRDFGREVRLAQENAAPQTRNHARGQNEV